MIHILAKHWWVLILRGIASLAFAGVSFLMPEFTFGILVTLIGVYLLADGILATYSGWRLRGQDEEWWVAVLEGLIGVGLGVASLANPEISATLLVTFIAIWCLLTGAFEIALAIRIRKEIEDEWQLAFAGVISIALGVLMLVQPNAGALSIAWWVGFYATFFGLLLIGLGIRLRRWLPPQG
ncbi:MAG: HdeD family acid-resistance protein [Lewinellaceae bacterium]|nr:HdeD family acid-resistance protein [Saprospiraceae bacterium]MCB9317291.1 HdeD family acid-resistance protein [Lewinellaceae bacterium]MCB9333678.1 HdeD family acid-resistance protein [Lewinellaceae bacterium]